MQTISCQTYGTAETDHWRVTQQTGYTTDHFTRLILMRRNHEAELRGARTKFIQRLMRCLQTRFAAVQCLCITNRSCKCHFDYPSATGMVKWKVVPFLNSLSNQMRPPCISTRLLVIFKPRPVPGTSRAFVSSERKNLWNIFT